MVYRPETFEEFLASGYMDEQGPEQGRDDWEFLEGDADVVRPVAAEAGIGRGELGGRRGRPLEREIRVLEDGIARLGVMLADGEADAREVALPLARMVRALSMALRTQQGIVARDEEVVVAAMRRVARVNGRMNE